MATASAPVASLPRQNLFGVEVMRVGSWPAHMYGPDGEQLDVPLVITEQMLDDVVAAAKAMEQNPPERGAPGVVLQHTDPMSGRIPSDPATGEPLYGRLTNVRRDGERVLVDVIGVLTQHVSAMASGFDARSVELAFDMTHAGTVYSAALTGLAFDIGTPAVSGMEPVFPRLAAATYRRARFCRSASALTTPNPATGGNPVADDKIPASEPSWIGALVTRVAAALKPSGGTLEPTKETPANSETAIAAAKAVAEVAQLKARADAADVVIAAQRATLEAITAKAANDAAEALVEAQIRAGKIAPAQVCATTDAGKAGKAALLTFAKADPAGFAALYASAPKLVNLGPASGTNEENADAPSAVDIAAAKAAHGFRTDEAAIKYLAELKARASGAAK